MDYSTFLAIVLVIGAWFILSRWILPIFGIRTCGCCCSEDPRPLADQEVNSEVDSEETDI